MTLRNTAREKLVLRLASRDAASAVELSRSLAEVPDGRAFSTATGGSVQVAVVGDGADLDGPAQGRALVALADQVGVNDLDVVHLPVPQANVLPTDVPPSGSVGAVTIGLDDLFVEPVIVDLAATPTLALSGPDLSGRTNALTWVARTFHLQRPDTVSLYLAGRAEPPLDADAWTHVYTDLVAALETLEAFAADIAERGRLDAPLLVAIDDGDELAANPLGLQPDEMQLRKRLATVMDSFHRSGRTAGVTLLLAGRLTGIGSSVPWAQRFRQNGQALLLAPATLDGGGTDPVFNVQLPRRAGYRPAAGDAVVLRRGAAPCLARLVLSTQV